MSDRFLFKEGGIYVIDTILMFAEVFVSEMKMTLNYTTVTSQCPSVSVDVLTLISIRLSIYFSYNDC